MGFWKKLLRDRVKVAVSTDYPQAAHWIYIESSDEAGNVYLELPSGRKRSCRPIAVNWLDDSVPIDGIGVSEDLPMGSAGYSPTGEEKQNPTAILTVWDQETGERMTWNICCSPGQYRHIRRIFNRAARYR